MDAVLAKPSVGDAVGSSFAGSGPSPFQKSSSSISMDLQQQSAQHSCPSILHGLNFILVGGYEWVGFCFVGESECRCLKE